MPFRSPDVTIDYIREIADRSDRNEVCVFFADDGEKFGLWPRTYRLVYKKGWLKNFLVLLEENSEWLQTVTYSEVLDTISPEEVAEVPESSYAEMVKWSGGNFKNFMKKYPEAERMHKRMLSVSDVVNEMSLQDDNGPAEDSRIHRAKKELFKAQTSCAYWHGTFAGLYLPHLRSGVYEHLIKAQDIIDRAWNKDDIRVRVAERDITSPERETVIENKFINIFVEPSGGGIVNELDYKPLNVNLVNTISRVKEDYHKKLGPNYSARIEKARKSIARGKFEDIHDVLGVGERGLQKVLSYDDYQRGSFLTHIFKNRRPWRKMREGHASNNNFLTGMYASDIKTSKEFVTHRLSKRDKVFIDNGRSFELEAVKEITVGAGPAVMFSHKILRHSGGPLFLRYAVEFNFLINDSNVMARPRLAKTDRVSLKDRYSGIGMDFFLDKKYFVFRYPVYSVNETERGLRKTFQGIALLVGDDHEFEERGCTDDMRITVAVG